MYCLSGAGLIACKDMGLFETFSCPWPLSATCYKLLEIERIPYSPGIRYTRGGTKRLRGVTASLGGGKNLGLVEPEPSLE